MASEGGTTSPVRALGLRDLLAAVIRRWHSIRIWVELIRNLAVRDVETRYKHSLLGLYWAIINPLLMAVIYSFVFTVIFHASSKPIPYVVFLLTGLTFWNLFANSIMSATGSVTGNAALLSKLYFPRVVIPTASVIARFIDFLFALFVLAVFILTYHVRVYSSLIWIVPIVGVQTLFALGVGYLLAAFNVLYRDMTQLVGLLLMVWMYLSPVMYPIGNVSNTIQSILLINPMGAMIQAERDLLFTGSLTQAPYLWAAVAWAGFLFLFGLYQFKRVEPSFAEVL
ncbi:MAG: ABC transporter permease [Acidobacteriaceae bacterium]